MNIVLTGMRGSGKSYQGRRLAKTLGWKLVDTDPLIEEKAGMSTGEIVAQNGWPHFRKLEKEVAAEVSKLDEHIISTGGGLIIDKENEQLLRENGKVIFLYRTPENCAKFLANSSKERPDLGQTPSEIWQKREKRYRESSDLIIDVNEEVAPEEILEKLQDI